MQYLTIQGLFVSSQFSLVGKGGEWTYSDFVALDFRAREIQFVKVSAAYDIGHLVEKVENREDLFRKLIPELTARGILVADWTPVVRVFIRQDRREFMSSKFGRCPDVRIEVLEDMAFPWHWPWNQWS